MADLEFAAWAQTRLGAAVEATDTDGDLGPATFRPGVSVSGPERFTMRGPTMTLLGPGGAIGLDPSLVLRQDPPPGATQVEDNYLASIEFRTPELPWLLTPAHAGPNQRLRPWIVLVVVEAVTVGRRPLPVIEVHTDELPDLRDSWAWAHVQLPSPAAMPPAGLEALVGHELSRLVCPRHLEPGKQYRACVVPAFAGGVAAGLGLTGPETNSHAPAWRIEQPGRVTVPVYVEWGFSTSAEGGDFEDLVKLLVPADLTGLPGFGARIVDVSEPWRTDAPLLDDRPVPERRAPLTVAVQGALRPFGPAPQGSATPTALTDLADRLRQQIDAPADRLERAGPIGENNGHNDGDELADHTGAVAPPLYGGRHWNRVRVHRPADEFGPRPKDWLSMFNLAAPTRIGAGLGAEYVRAHQEELMARAWDQVGAVREANRLRAIAELATAVATSVHRRHVSTLSAGELVGLSAPAARRVRLGGGPTLSMEVAVSPLPNAVASSAFARMLRPAGGVARASQTGLDSIVAGGLRGTLRVPDPEPVLARLSVEVPEVAGTELADATAAARIAVDATATARQLVVFGAVAEVAQANGLGQASLAVGDGIRTISGVDMGHVRGGDVPAVRVSIAPQLTEVAQILANVVATGLGANPAVDGRVVDTMGVQIDAQDIRSRLAAALHPGDRIERRLASRIEIPAGQRRPGLEPVMAYPTFPIPMALALLDTDKEWFLPGVGVFPVNRVTVLEQNDMFIESYLAGLNHEMMRELRWREYPTDLRGTPFRRFWPRPDGEPDVPPMDTWGFRPGDNLDLAGVGIAVLLVRGDVIRRFPDLVTAAAPAVPGPGGRGRTVPNPDPTTWRPPLFVIGLDGSTAAYAFEIDAAELSAGPTPGAEGWFFVFQEHSYRIRFGFDRSSPASFKSWNDLAWPMVPTDGRGFALAGAGLAPPSNPAGAQWGTHAADMARIALQRPFRVAVHASTLVNAQG